MFYNCFIFLIFKELKFSFNTKETYTGFTLWPLTGKRCSTEATRYFVSLIFCVCVFFLFCSTATRADPPARPLLNRDILEARRGD